MRPSTIPLATPPEAPPPAAAATLGIEPLLAQADLRHVLACSQRSIDRLRASGRLPRPDLMIGRSPRWRPSTIRDWIEQGGHS